jgi:anti-sigma-K factor RskA
MDYSEDHIALAAEYALGTLDAEERAQVESMMSVDKEFAGIVQAWEFRLGVLNQMVGSVEPPPEIWEKIRNSVALSGERQAPLALPEPPTVATPPSNWTDLGGPGLVASVAADTSDVVPFVGQARRWRNIARVASALAAALVALIGLQIFAPGMLPDALRPTPRTQIVEVKSTQPAPAPASSAQYVALLQGQTGGPAFILTVDGTTKDFTVRKLGAPPAESGKSYELWLISDKLGNRPRSLGVIGASDFTARPILAAYDSDVINSATYAVTIEQAGGSPDGAPHSQPVFAGKLIETVQPSQ